MNERSGDSGHEKKIADLEKQKADLSRKLRGKSIRKIFILFIILRVKVICDFLFFSRGVVVTTFSQGDACHSFGSEFLPDSHFLGLKLSVRTFNFFGKTFSALPLFWVQFL